MSARLDALVRLRSAALNIEPSQVVLRQLREAIEEADAAIVIAEIDGPDWIREAEHELHRYQDAVMEECAAIADTEATAWQGTYDGEIWVARKIAAGIRALKSKSPDAPPLPAAEPADEDAELIEWLGKASNAIYLATDKIVADDISPKLVAIRARLTALSSEVVEAAMIREAQTHMNGRLLEDNARFTAESADLLREVAELRATRPGAERLAIENLGLAHKISRLKAKLDEARRALEEISAIQRKELQPGNCGQDSLLRAQAIAKRALAEGERG